MLDIIRYGKETLEIEAQSILDQVELLGEEFESAVKLIAASKGKLIVTGMGKSGIIGKKIAATLASTGTPSLFMHPGEAYHGDLGMVMRNEIVLMLSNSGETDELIKIIPFFNENSNPIIAITGNLSSTLAIHAAIHLLIKIKREACPLSLAPTSSTTTLLALGDAIAVALMKLKGFKEQSFARFHPGGNLGRRLLMKVEDVMQKKNLPIISRNSNLTEIINVIGKGRLGLALVVEHKKTVGIITDGDLRRLMEFNGKLSFDMVAEDFMTIHPRSISSQSSLIQAEELFNKHKINSLVVIDENDDFAGVIQIYNL